MNFDYDKTWESLKAVLKKELDIMGSWNAFIDLIEKQISKPYWQSLKELALESEQEDIREWIENLALESPLPDDIKALWIGIIRVEGDDGQEIPTIYLVGSNNYNEDDIDWASEPTYMPDNRYVCPTVLREIDNIIRTDQKDYQFLDWILPIAYCALTLDEIIRIKINRGLLLGRKKILHVTVGHDSGDYLEISPLEKRQPS